MDAATATLTHEPPCRATCPRMVCRCLQVTEQDLLHALDTEDIHDLRDLRRCTGAGDGCTACHRTLRKYLDQRRRELATVTAQPSPSSSSCPPI